MGGGTEKTTTCHVPPFLLTKTEFCGCASLRHRTLKWVYIGDVKEIDEAPLSNFITDGYELCFAITIPFLQSFRICSQQHHTNVFGRVYGSSNPLGSKLGETVFK